VIPRTSIKREGQKGEGRGQNKEVRGRAKFNWLIDVFMFMSKMIPKLTYKHL